MRLKKVYLVRQVYLVDDFGSIRIDEEAVFSKDDKAFEYLQSLFDFDAADKSIIRFRNILSTLKLDDTQNWENTDERVFSLDGQELEHITPQNNTPIIPPIENEDTYNIGDIVRVKSKLETPKSFSVEGTLAVIAAEESEGYIIYFVGENGFVRHEHANSLILGRKLYLTDENNILLRMAYFFKGDTSAIGSDAEGVLNGKFYVGGHPSL